MKKNLFRIASAVLGLCLLASTLLLLTACDLASFLPKGKTAPETEPDLSLLEEGERADLIYEFLDKDISTYAADTHMLLAGKMYGVYTEVEGDMTTYRVGLYSLTPVIHSQTNQTTRVTVDNEIHTVEATRIDGYRDGKMYEYEEGEDGKHALVSAITFPEYMLHKDTLSGGEDEDPDSALREASHKTAVQDSESGNWIATFSGYSEEALDVIVDDLLDDIIFLLQGARPSDVTITAEITEAHIPVGMTFEVAFEQVEADQYYIKPAFSVEMTFKDIGTAVAPEVDLSTYTEVDDLRVLDTVQTEMSRLHIGDNISFTATSEAEATYDGQTESQRAIDQVKTKIRNGRFTFTVVETQSPDTEDEFTLNLTYNKNETLRITGDGITAQTLKMEPVAAQALVTSLLDPASITSAYIADIEVGEDGSEYIFTIADPDYAEYEKQYAAMNPTDSKAKASLTVIMKNGSIAECFYEFVYTAEIDGKTVTVNKFVTVVIDGETAEDEPSVAA